MLLTYLIRNAWRLENCQLIGLLIAFQVQGNNPKKNKPVSSRIEKEQIVHPLPAQIQNPIAIDVTDDLSHVLSQTIRTNFTVVRGKPEFSCKMAITCGIYLYSTLKKKLLVCHATHARWNQWSIPKGLKEDEHESFDAAARELIEETGINIEKTHVLSTFSLPLVKYQKQNKILESFLVITDTDIDEITFESNRVPGKPFGEIDSWKWISITEAGKWLHESQQKNLEVIKELIETLPTKNSF